MDSVLMEMASDLGVVVEHAELDARNGEYRHDLRLIRLRPGMTIRQERSVLAHEVAHAVFEDVPSRFGPVNAKQERRADEWAALRLISPVEYRTSEERWGGHVGAIAFELGVTASLVRAYQRVLLRIGDTVYVKPRMGAGGWAHKLAVA